MENHWSTQNVDVEIITMGEMKEALKNKKSPSEDNLNSELINMQESHFMTDY